jgi:hypothetical protein
MTNQAQLFGITDKYLTIGFKAERNGVVRFESVKLDLTDPDVAEALDRAIQMVFTIRARDRVAWVDQDQMSMF